MGSNSSLDTLSVMSLPTVERSKSWNNMRQKSEDTMSLYSLSEDYDSGVTKYQKNALTQLSIQS